MIETINQRMCAFKVIRGRLDAELRVSTCYREETHERNY